MPIDLDKIVRDLNKAHPDDEYEAALDFVTQNIILRRRVRVPLVVATRSNIEDNQDLSKMYEWALDWVRGRTMVEYDFDEAVKRLQEEAQRKREMMDRVYTDW